MMMMMMMMLIDMVIHNNFITVDCSIGMIVDVIIIIMVARRTSNQRWMSFQKVFNP
eukprot:Awhi_evm1s3428